MSEMWRQIVAQKTNSCGVIDFIDFLCVFFSFGAAQSDNEAACDVEFQRRVLALCGPDLLCQSQSRHLLSALGQLEQMEADYLIPAGGQPRIEALCRRDSCLAEFWKRR